MNTACTAFLYPGQGSQRVGMGLELYKQQPALFEQYLAAADEVSQRPVSKACLEGSIEYLTDTQITQPALFALSSALTDYARSIGLAPGLVAGHSLGEYSAAVAAGVLTFEDGLRLVCERARLMASAQLSRPGSMAMIAGLSSDAIRQMCEETTAGFVALANLNAPQQTVVAGDRAGVDELIERAERGGATETLLLQVDVAGHTHFMQPAADHLLTLFETTPWHDPVIPMVANVSGQILTTAREIRDALVAQISQPVQWIKCVERMGAYGCTHFLEVGPGRVLSGLVRQILPDAVTYASASPRRILAFAAPAGE